MNSEQQSTFPVEVLSALNNVAKEAILMFQTLLQRAIASGVPTDPSRLHDLERELHALVARCCVDPVVGALIQATHSSPEVSASANAVVAAYPNLRLQSARETVRVTLLGGSVVDIVTPYFLVRVPANGRKGMKGKRGAEGNGIYPFLAVLGIHFRVSPAMLNEVACLVARGNVQIAVDTLAARGVSLDRKVVTRWAQRLAERGIAYRDWLMEQGQSARPEESGVKGMRLVIGTDGGRLRTRVAKPGRRRRSGRRGFKGVWREPKVIVIYEIDDDGRKLTRGFLWYDATLEDADGLFKILAATLISIGAADAKEWTFVGDGADWIWNRIPSLVSEVGYNIEKVTQIVDYYHATEHLRAVAAAVKSWNLTQQRAWYRRVRPFLRHGNISRVLEEIEKLCIGRRARHMRTFLTYFEKHKHRMAYKAFERRKLPIGSGAVESGVRRLVNLRFKGNGIFWLSGNAEGILHLRAQLLAGRWSQFISTVLKPEPCWKSEPRTQAPSGSKAAA